MKRIVLSIALLILVLSACTPTAQNATATPIPQTDVQEENTPTKTNPPEPTHTQEPEPGITEEKPVSTATTTPEFTPTPNPFADANIISYGHINNSTLLVTIEVPGGVPAGEYIALVEENEYTCEVLPAFPERLYCTGPAISSGKTIIVEIYKRDIKLFQGIFIVPKANGESSQSGVEQEDENVGSGGDIPGEGPSPD
jgi:hypothetical protein